MLRAPSQPLPRTHPCILPQWGWDCFRHYEILGNGAIPYFLDLESSPKQTMALLPKALLLKARALSGVPVFNFTQLMGSAPSIAAPNIAALLKLDKVRVLPRGASWRLA